MACAFRANWRVINEHTYINCFVLTVLLAIIKLFGGSLKDTNMPCEGHTSIECLF